MEAEEIKELIISSLECQGFRFQNGKILPPENLDKESIRTLHCTAVNYKIERSKEWLKQKEPQLLKRIAAGNEINPLKICPRLVLVQPDSDDELLFRYVSLHWSIPVSSGYGRRLRFLVVDEQNEKLIGIIGLGDPVFSLKARDDWVGWNKEERCSRLQHVMDAFVLGAVPPYSFLLCGKLIAMVVASDEVRKTFKKIRWFPIYYTW